MRTRHARLIISIATSKNKKNSLPRTAEVGCRDCLKNLDSGLCRNVAQEIPRRGGKGQGDAIDFECGEKSPRPEKNSLQALGSVLRRNDGISAV
jgi:hypothetical protein